MQTRTTPTNEPAVPTSGIVEREVETVRTRQRVDGAPVNAASAPRTVAPDRRSGQYFETLPERLQAVAVVVLVTIEGLIGARFLLHAFGANANNSFVGFIDNVSWPFVRPFATVFSDRSWGQGIIELSTLVAMGVYLLLFALIGMLIAALAPRVNGHGDGVA